MSKLSLDWNDFEEALANSISSLRKEEHLFDVTFVTDDEKLIKAHKLVLSASSTFFQNLFKKTPGFQYQDSLIYSYGIDSRKLNSIIEYMYNGKVEIREDEVDSFILIAQNLKIKGLMTEFEAEGDTENNQEKTTSTITSDQIVDFWEEDFSGKPMKSHSAESELIIQTEIVKNESKPRSTKKDNAQNLNKNSIYKSLNSVEAKDFSLGQEFRYKTLNEIIMKNSDNTWACIQCGKTYNNRSAVNSHVEFHIEGQSYECGMCLKKFKTSSSLSGHVAKCLKKNPKKF